MEVLWFTKTRRIADTKERYTCKRKPAVKTDNYDSEKRLILNEREFKVYMKREKNNQMSDWCIDGRREQHLETDTEKTFLGCDKGW